MLGIRKKFGFLMLLLLVPMLGGQESMAVSAKKDQDYQWLEDLESEKALNWVKDQNARSLSAIRAYKDYPLFKEEAAKILEAKDKIPYGRILGDFVYNFWQDAEHVRGIWRRSSWSDYQSGKPKWDVLLDLDALGAKEGKSYVFGGAQCLKPDYQRCLISISEGGSDAAFYREFDIKTKDFVKDGFSLPASKSGLSWIDRDHVFFDNALAAETQTSSGYPIESRIWKRGTPQSESKLVFKGEKDDVAVRSFVVHDQGQEHRFINRALSFYTSKIYYLKGEERVELPLPLDIDFVALFKGQFLITNRSQLGIHKPGSLLAVPFETLLASQKTPAFELVFTPSEQQALDGIARGADYLYVGILDQVRSKVLRFERKQVGEAASWVDEALPVDDQGTIGLTSVDEFSNRLLLIYEDFLVPSSLYAVDGQKLSKTLVMQAPPRFTADGLQIHQEFAKGKDGTRVPYFLVHRKGLKLDGKNPTLLYGYGGFEVAMQPSYASVTGKLWLERGGVYVLANIRGGGEFGPRWHQAALKENRQKAFDDFVAVAEDLIKAKITSPQHLGIQGGSNGGLLMGATFTQRPELFKAVVCQVPLLDMLRYHKLLAGASWMAEYGNPDEPKMASVIKKYSPFHNLQEKKTYPEVFFVTSTKDDRVHPGHARKMAARMADLKKPFLYYENIEGGHSASADLQQMAERYALQYAYLWSKLSGESKK